MTTTDTHTAPPVHTAPVKVTTTYSMLDTVNVANIPPDKVKEGYWLAGYVDGAWPTYPQLCKLYPHAQRLISIATDVRSYADVLDVEGGDAAPDQVPSWLLKMRADNRLPVVYTSRSNVDAVAAACHKAGVVEPYYWTADWTGEAHLNPGAVATQWANGTETYPGLALGCDSSLVGANFPPRYKETPQVPQKTITVPSKATIYNLIREIGALSAVLVGVIPQTNLPQSTKNMLVAAGSLILSITHYTYKTTK
jgi:hypothetical protein